MTQPTPIITVRVHNFKDDLDGSLISSHGPFETPEAACEFVKEVRDAYGDFTSGSIVMLLPPTIEAVKAAQRLSW